MTFYMLINDLGFWKSSINGSSFKYDPYKDIKYFIIRLKNKWPLSLIPLLHVKRRVRKGVVHDKIIVL